MRNRSVFEMVLSVEIPERDLTMYIVNLVASKIAHF